MRPEQPAMSRKSDGLRKQPNGLAAIIRRIRNRYIEPVDAAGLDLETRYEYDVCGGEWYRTKMRADPAGLDRQTVYAYYDANWTDDEKAAGAFGNVIKETRPVGGVVRRTYDKADRLLTVPLPTGPYVRRPGRRGSVSQTY